MLERLAQQAIEQPARGRRPGRIEQVARRQAQRRQLAGRQVTTAVAQVRRHVAQDVRQLQGLAEPHAGGAHGRDVPAGEPWPVSDVHPRPELADAAGDQIRVAIEVGQRVERGQGGGVLAGKAFEVEALALGDRGEHRAHGRAVGGREEIDATQRLADTLQQLALGGVGLQRRAGARKRGRVAPGRPGVGGAQGREVAQPLGARQEPRVRHRVARARQQIREADGLTQRARQDCEREIEASTDPPEQVTDEVFTRSRRGDAADPASPWPS